MRDMLQFYINGEWVDPVEPKSIEVINPATDEVCGHISMGSAADVLTRELLEALYAHPLEAIAGPHGPVWLPGKATRAGGRSTP